MAVFRRYKGKRIKHGDKNYAKGTWYAEGSVAGQYYKESLKHRAKTREDAEKEEDLIIARIRAGEYDYHRDKTTFAAYVADTYQPFVENNNPSWRGNKKYQIERLVKYFGETPLKQLTRAKCEAFKAWRTTQKIKCEKCLHDLHSLSEECNAPRIAPSTVNRDLVTLSKILSLAVADGRIKENPMRFVPLLKEPESRERFLSAEEKERLLSAIGENKRLLAIVTLALTTGWRKGQILAIKKEDLDAQTQTVLRAKSKQQTAKRMPVNDVAWSVLQYLAQRVEAGWLFRNERTGEQLKCFKEVWWNALAKAEIKDFRFHDLRRSCATELLRLGVNELTVRDVLGHQKIETTAIYARVTDADLRNSLAKLGDGFDEWSEIIEG